MTRSIRIFMAIAVPVLAFALTPRAATAQSYTGNWPMTETVTGQFAGTYTYCLTLTDNGTDGFPHSGPATLNGSGFTNLTGIFQVVNNLFVATFYVQSGEGSLSGLVFVGPASKGTISKGFGESVSGAATVTGKLTFGTKGDCGNSQ